VTQQPLSKTGPHQEQTLDATEPVQFVVMRSDNERIAVPLPDVALDDHPEFVF
jgi:hypothetical protein